MLLAQVNFDNPNVFPPARIDTVASLMNIVIPLLILGGALLFLVMALFAAFRIVSGGDNADQIKKAQQTLGVSVLGIVIVACSYLLVRIIGVILGIKNILPI